MSRYRIPRKKGATLAARRWRSQSGPPLAFRLDPWTRRLIRPLLISLLATAVAIALLVIVRSLSPQMEWMLLVPLCFFVALEGAYTTAWLKNPDSYGVDRLVYRLTEIFLIIVIARLYSWTVFGEGFPSPDEMRLYLSAPVTLFAVGGFITTTFVALVSWWVAVSLGRIFALLDVSVYEVNYYTLPLVEQKERADDRPLQISRDTLYQQYLNLWLAGGVVMILIAALSTFEMGQLTEVINPFDITRLGLSPAMLLALMLYFLAGFWLLSHARLLRMHARWLMDGVAKEADLERGWQRQALAVILSVAVIAAFLPIGDSLAISHILRLGVTGLAYLAGLILSFFGMVFGSALLLLTENVEEGPLMTPEPTPPPPTFEPPVTPPPTADPFLAMVITSAFWALTIAIIIAAFVFFFRERGYRLDSGQIGQSWTVVADWLRDLWRRLTRRLRAARRGASDMVREMGTAARATHVDLPRPNLRLLRPNALPPREQIRYYYLALLQRAADRGVRRQESDTPLEFSHDLKEHWPEAEAELEELTRAFLEARYSPQPVEKERASSVRRLWNDLRLRLRPRK